MKNRGRIIIQTLGGFSFSVVNSEGVLKRIDTTGRAKRLWSIIEYLIIFRGREISVDELIETFWADKAGNNPLVTLQNNISRARSALAELGFPHAKDMIICVTGHYAWNPDIPVEVDAEKFEAIYKDTRSGSSLAGALLEAINLYHGDFLSGNTDEWTSPPRIYYRSLYTDMCRSAIHIFSEQEQWIDVVSVCEQAFRINPDIEEFSVYFMRALTALGQPKKALEHYETVKCRILDEYGVIPSDELELARTQAAHSQTGVQFDYDTVLSLMTDQQSIDSAFFCDYNVFCHLVWQQARSMLRTKEEAQIKVISLIFAAGSAPKAPPATDMKRLERTLSSSLRAGDPFARLSATQFIMMLPNTTPETADIVMARVEACFRKAYPRSRACILPQSIPMESLLPDRGMA